MAEAEVGPVVVDGREAELSGQRFNVLILAHHRDRGELRGGHRLERAADERPAVQIGGQLVAAEAPAAITRQPSEGSCSMGETSLSVSTKQYTHFWA